MTASVRGMAAQHLFVAMALEFGWNPSLPVADDLEYDVLLEEADGSSSKVQVKRIYLKDGYRTVNLVRKDGSRYKRSDADWLAAVDMKAGKFYLVPWEEVYRFSRKRITDDWTHYSYGL